MAPLSIKCLIPHLAQDPTFVHLNPDASGLPGVSQANRRTTAQGLTPAVVAIDLHPVGPAPALSLVVEPVPVAW